MCLTFFKDINNLELRYTRSFQSTCKLKTHTLVIMRAHTTGGTTSGGWETGCLPCASTLDHYILGSRPVHMEVQNDKASSSTPPHVEQQQLGATVDDTATKNILYNQMFDIK
jgi:hypothetical protein